MINIRCNSGFGSQYLLYLLVLFYTNLFPVSADRICRFHHFGVFITSYLRLVIYEPTDHNAHQVFDFICKNHWKQWTDWNLLFTYMSLTLYVCLFWWRTEGKCNTVCTYLCTYCKDLWANIHWWVDRGSLFDHSLHKITKSWEHKLNMLHTSPPATALQPEKQILTMLLAIIRENRYFSISYSR